MKDRLKYLSSLNVKLLIIDYYGDTHYQNFPHYTRFLNFLDYERHELNKQKQRIKNI